MTVTNRQLLDLTEEELENRITLLTDILDIKRFNAFRENYVNLSFNDLKTLSREWYKRFPNQNRYNRAFFITAIDAVVDELGAGARIVELGGFEGGLAYTVFLRHPHLTWLNCEVIDYEPLPMLEHFDFGAHVLSAQMWDEFTRIDGYDVFVSSDMIEHLSSQHLRKLFALLIESKIKYLIIQSPLSPHGQTWDNYLGSHVLEMGSDEIKAILGKAYRLMGEEGEWHSVWRRTDE